MVNVQSQIEGTLSICRVNNRRIDVRPNLLFTDWWRTIAKRDGVKSIRAVEKLGSRKEFLGKWDCQNVQRSPCE